MSEQAVLKPKDYKSDITPIWCPGCGDFGNLAAPNLGHLRFRNLDDVFTV